MTWVPAAARSEAGGEVGKILARARAGEGGALLIVNEFDRVLEGDDVDRWVRVDLIDHCGKSRRFAAPGGAVDENQACFSRQTSREGKRVPGRGPKSVGIHMRAPHAEENTAAMLVDIESKTEPVTEG